MIETNQMTLNRRLHKYLHALAFEEVVRATGHAGTIALLPALTTIGVRSLSRALMTPQLKRVVP